MLIQIILTVIAAATASAMFAAGVRRPRMDYRPILAALAEDGDDVLPPDGHWQPVNQWESVLTSTNADKQVKQ